MKKTITATTKTTTMQWNCAYKIFTAINVNHFRSLSHPIHLHMRIGHVCVCLSAESSQWHRTTTMKISFLHLPLAMMCAMWMLLFCASSMPKVVCARRPDKLFIFILVVKAPGHKSIDLFLHEEPSMHCTTVSAVCVRDPTEISSIRMFWFCFVGFPLCMSFGSIDFFFNFFRSLLTVSNSVNRQN